MKTRQKPFSQHRRALLGLGLWLLSAAALADPANPLSGFYYGSATITQPANLGIVDLAFYLDVTGSAIQQAGSYIDPDKTLLFPAVEPQIDGKAVGPRVSGKLSSSDFVLTSQAFPGMAGGKAVSRAIRLHNAKVDQGGAALTGEYTETVEGMTPAPLVIKGKFRLMKPLATVLAAARTATATAAWNSTKSAPAGPIPTWSNSATSAPR